MLIETLKPIALLNPAHVANHLTELAMEGKLDPVNNIRLYTTLLQISFQARLVTASLDGSLKYHRTELGVGADMEGVKAIEHEVEPWHEIGDKFMEEMRRMEAQRES